MSHAVKAYICWVAGVGALAIGSAFTDCQLTHPVRFPVYFALAVLTSTIKVRFTQITGTLSCSLVFAILAIAELDRAEAMLVAIAAAAGQTLLNVREKPVLVQLIFNVAAIAISTLAATAGRAAALKMGAGPVLAISCCAAVFYIVNTLVVSAVLAMIHAREVRALWTAWLRWATPAFLASGAAAVAVFALDPGFDWHPALLLIPCAVLFQLWYRRLVGTRLIL